MLHVARWKCKTQKIAIWAPSHNLLGYIFTNKGTYRQSEKNLLNSNISPTFLQYGELRLTSGWDQFVSLRHPCKFQRVSHLGSVTARHCSSGRQPNCAALNRGRHLYSAGRPSRWALAHISSFIYSLFHHYPYFVRKHFNTLYIFTFSQRFWSNAFFHAKSHYRNNVFTDVRIMSLIRKQKGVFFWTHCTSTSQFTALLKFIHTAHANLLKQLLHRASRQSKLFAT